MIKKIFSLILCLVMTICLLPSTAYAATTISNADISIAHPVHLANPETFLQVYGNCKIDTTYNSKGHNNGLRWKDVSSGEYMDENDTFVGGKKYELSVMLISKTGYSFSSSTTSVTVNSDAAALDVRDVSHAQATIILTADKLFINYATIGGLDAPKAGKAADFSVSVQEKTCEIYPTTKDMIYNGVFWFDKTKEEYLKPGDKFVAGHKYAVAVYVQPKSGYEFQNNVQVTINAGKCTIGQNSGNLIQAVIEYSALAANTQENINTSPGSVPKITTKSLPNATKGKSYYVKLDCTDADAVFSEIMGSQLSEFGLTLTQHGEIEGKPTKAGNCHVNIRTVSENGSEDSTSFDITVSSSETSAGNNTPDTTSKPTQSTTSPPTDQNASIQSDTDNADLSLDNDGDGNNLSWLWIVLVVVIVAGGGFAFYWFVFKKKNSKA